MELAQESGLLLTSQLAPLSETSRSQVLSPVRARARDAKPEVIRK